MLCEFLAPYPRMGLHSFASVSTWPPSLESRCCVCTLVNSDTRPLLFRAYFLVLTLLTQHPSFLNNNHWLFADCYHKSGYITESAVSVAVIGRDFPNGPNISVYF